MIRLGEADLQAVFLGPRAQCRLDVRERRVPVYLRLPRAEHVEVWSVDDKDGMHLRLSPYLIQGKATSEERCMVEYRGSSAGWQRPGARRASHDAHRGVAD